MYTGFYNLHEPPFQLNTDPRFLWLGPKHKEALAALKYGILQNMGFVLLTGEIGTGKTTLINALVASLNTSTIVATIPDPNLAMSDFFRYLLTAFNISTAADTKLDFLSQFATFLKKCRDSHKNVLIIIDESQRIPMDLLDEIRVLSNIEMGKLGVLNVFFVGQSEFNDKLVHQSCRAIRQRITVNYHLEKLSERETKDYIQHRLKVAGSTEKIFAENAIRAIYSFSDGCPRLINIICEKALLTGYVKDLNIITEATIRACGNQLRLHDENAPETFSKSALLSKINFSLAGKIVGYCILLFFLVIAGYKAQSLNYRQYITHIKDYYGPIYQILVRSTKTSETHKDDGVKTPTADEKSSLANSKSKPDGKSQVPTRTTRELPPADSHAQGGEVNEQKEETTRPGPFAERNNDRRSPAPGQTAALAPGQTQPAPESGSKRAGAQAVPFQGIKLVIPLTNDSRELSPTTLRMLDKMAGVATRNPKTFILLKVYPPRGANSGQIDGLANPQTASVTKYFVARKINVSRIRTILPDRGSLLERGRSSETSDSEGRIEIELTDVAVSPSKR